VKGIAALAVLLAVVPLLLPNAYWFDVAVHVQIAAVAAIGLNVLLGFAGQISVGHAALLAAAGYVSGILATSLGWPVPICMVAGVAAVTAASWLLAWPLLRLQGHALTIATLGLGIIVQLVLTNESAWTGGPDGMAVPPLELAGWSIETPRQWYALGAAVLIAAVALSLNLVKSPAGRALRALNGSDVAAQSSGVDVTRYKVAAFAVSAGFAATAGVLEAHYSGFITPGAAGFMPSVALATMVVVGGRGSTFGAVAGALLLTSLPQLLGGFAEYELVLFGLVLMATVIFLPQGLMPALAGAWHARAAKEAARATAA
jgi:branched-chain amino acid transport system permease protein